MNFRGSELINPSIPSKYTGKSTTISIIVIYFSALTNGDKAEVDAKSLDVCGSLVDDARCSATVTGLFIERYWSLSKYYEKCFSEGPDMHLLQLPVICIMTND